MGDLDAARTTRSEAEALATRLRSAADSELGRRLAEAREALDQASR